MSLAGAGLVQVILTLGIGWGIGGSRIVRSAVIGIKENMYMQAAEAVGSSRLRTIVRHVLPNVAAPIIVLFTLNTGGAILTEATLSFLGFGVPPPAPSWGGMLSVEGRNYMLQAPWMALWPGIALTLTVFGINVLGDALRDILDPRLRGGIGRYGRKVQRRTK
jgi:peptide/nickel transport system permease protein